MTALLERVESRVARQRANAGLAPGTELTDYSDSNTDYTDSWLDGAEYADTVGR